MNQINLDMPRGTIVAQVVVAALAAVGLISLVPPAGGREQAMIVVPILTALLAVALVLRTRASIRRARKEAGSATATDPLTGVATVATGEQVLDMEFSAAQRERGRPLSVVLIRLEQLSEYRARHGQVVTDKLLREAGRILDSHRRGMHLTARYAGDPGTFLSVLSGVERDGAAVYATRVRRDLLRIQGVPRPVGISVGIAAYDMSMKSPQQLLRRAAFALKKGTAAGGKVVVVQAAPAA